MKRLIVAGPNTTRLPAREKKSEGLLSIFSTAKL